MNYLLLCSFQRRCSWILTLVTHGYPSPESFFAFWLETTHKNTQKSFVSCVLVLYIGKELAWKWSKSWKWKFHHFQHLYSSLEAVFLPKQASPPQNCYSSVLFASAIIQHYICYHIEINKKILKLFVFLFLIWCSIFNFIHILRSEASKWKQNHIHTFWGVNARVVTDGDGVGFGGVWRGITFGLGSASELLRSDPELPSVSAETIHINN